MSEKESGANMLKVALLASIMTGVVFVGGGYFAVKMLNDAIFDNDIDSVQEVDPASVPVTSGVPAMTDTTVAVAEPEPVPELEVGPEGLALIESLRIENRLVPYEGPADMSAAGSIGYIPRISSEIVNSEEALADFSEKVPGLSAIMGVPTFDDEVALLEMPEINEAFSGEAIVRGPGLISVGGREVSISGIISPITSDQCMNANGNSFSCGSWALGAWTAAVHLKTVHCLLLGDSEGGTPDARCEMETGGTLVDIGSWAVTAGVALADQDEDVRYLSEEGLATQKGLGLWSTAFEFGGVRNSVEMIPEDASPIEEAVTDEASGSNDASVPVETEVSEE